MGASGQFASRRGNYYSGLLPQSQATSSQYALGYSKPISSPQSTSSQSASVLRPRKQYASASQGSSGAQFGASTGFASQGMSSSYSGSAQSQGTTSQFAPGSPSPYDSLYCKCALSPQGVDRESTTVQSTRKQFTARYATQSGSSTPFTLQGSITYDRSPRPQGTASQLGPVSHSYPSVSSPSQGVSSQSTSVQFSRKRLASTYTGSSGTQAGSSPPFTRREVPLMVDHLHLKMSQVRLPLDLNPPMQVCHCPHPKLVHLPLFRVLGSSLHLPSQGPLAPSQDPLLSSPCREALLMVDHLNVKMLLVNLSVGGLPHMQVCHCPHHKLLLVLVLFRVQGSGLHPPSQGALAPSQDPLLPSPCREALLMVDHLKMSQVRFTLGLPHMQVCRFPHPKVLLVSPANHIKAILCLKARSLKNGSLQPLV